MNKKLIVGILVMVFLVSIITVEAATISGWIKDGASIVAGGFKEAGAKEGNVGLSFYDRNTQLWDFLLFFVMYLSIAYLGLKQWIEKGGGAAKSLAVVIGAALALATLKAGMSVTFFIPFVKNALFFIMYMVVFLILLNITSTGEGEQKKKHVFWSLILAFIITYVMFNFAGLVTQGKGGLPWDGPDEEKLAKLRYQLIAKDQELASFEGEIKSKFSLTGFTHSEIRAELSDKIEALKDSKDKDEKKKRKELEKALKRFDKLWKGGALSRVRLESKGILELKEEIKLLEDKINNRGLEKGELGAASTLSKEGSGVPTDPEVELNVQKVNGNFKLTCIVTTPSVIEGGKGTPKYRYIFSSNFGGSPLVFTTKKTTAEITVGPNQGTSWNCKVVPLVDSVPGSGSSATVTLVDAEREAEGDIFANEDLMIEILEDLSN